MITGIWPSIYDCIFFCCVGIYRDIVMFVCIVVPLFDYTTIKATTKEEQKIGYFR